MIGTDNGLMAAPQLITNMTIGPAERCELIIDFSTYPIGTQVVLKNLLEVGSLGEIMRFDVVREESDDSTIPATLRNLEFIPESAAVRTRNFVFDLAGGIWAINGRGWDRNFVVAKPNLGDIEIWSLSNNHVDEPHLAHIHLVHFRILDRNGEPPFPYEQGMKDTVLLRPGETVRVLMRFGPHRGKYHFHCHMLDHEDNSMMTQFEVL